MTETQNNSDTKLAGMVGAIIGATVALAAAKILSDKKTRDTVIETITSLKDEVVDGLEPVTKKAEDAKDVVQDTFDTSPSKEKKPRTTTSRPQETA